MYAVSKKWRIAVALALLCAAFGALTFSLFKGEPPPNLDFSGQPITLEVYTGGRLMLTMTLDANSPLMEEVAFIIRRKDRRWRKSIVTYAPGVIIRSNTVHVNCGGNSVIVDYQGDQLVGDLTNDERERIAHAVESAMHK